MIESMLEPHLKRKAGASQSDVGITFLILGGVYMISSPIGGLVRIQILNFFKYLNHFYCHNILIQLYFVFKICDKLKYPTMISICGNAAMATAFLFLGPVPFIPLETNLSVIQGMVGLVGFGYALVMVSSFGRAQSAALNLGYVDDINTYIMISGKVSRYLQPNIFRFLN